MIVNAYIRRAPCPDCDGPVLVIRGNGNAYVDDCAVCQLPKGEDLFSTLDEPDLDEAARTVRAGEGKWKEAVEAALRRKGLDP